MNAAVPRLHAVTNDGVLDLPDFWERVSAVDAAGAVAIHLRSKTRSGRAMYEIAERLRTAVSILFVNDRVDLARLVGADGVHLPEAGLPVEQARALLPPPTLVGRSTHTTHDAEAAMAGGADYAFLGPVWSTESHPAASPIGLEGWNQTRGHLIAIGGVTPERVGPCLGAGAYGVAAIRAIWHADDPRAAAQAMLVSLG